MCHLPPPVGFITNLTLTSRETAVKHMPHTGTITPLRTNAGCGANVGLQRRCKNLNTETKKKMRETLFKNNSVKDQQDDIMQGIKGKKCNNLGLLFFFFFFLLSSTQFS